MKQYYTLIQRFSTVDDRNLAQYLTEQDIKYQTGADFISEYRSARGVPFGDNDHPNTLMLQCVALIEEHELSAIMPSVGGLTVVDNRPLINAKNKVRRCFKWIL